MEIKTFGTVLLTIADKDKEEALNLAKRFSAIGYRINGNKWYSRLLKGIWYSSQMLLTKLERKVLIY